MVCSKALRGTHVPTCIYVLDDVYRWMSAPNHGASLLRCLVVNTRAILYRIEARSDSEIPDQECKRYRPEHQIPTKLSVSRPVLFGTSVCRSQTQVLRTFGPHVIFQGGDAYVPRYLFDDVELTSFNHAGGPSFRLVNHMKPAVLGISRSIMCRPYGLRCLELSNMPYLGDRHVVALAYEVCLCCLFVY